MADVEDKAKAEKLAAAKKRVAQLQKQQAKARKKGAGAAEQDKKGEAASALTKTDETEAPPSTSSPPPVQEEEQQQQEQEEPSSQSPIAPRAPESDETPEPELFAPAPTKEVTTGESPSTRTPHARKQSLSVQSKLRSSDFRRTSVSQQTGAQPVAPSSNVKSPTLPPLNPDGDAVPEVFRKQALRLEELERENRRLERELEEAGARWKKSEEKLEDLGDARVELVEVQDRLGRAEKRAEEVERLKAEITVLQRQNAQLHSKSRTNSGAPGNSESPQNIELARPA
ncbi:M protein repeat protein [Histoplasma capsulatum]|uniref:M protein repeat protein n=1 Tax=Ajellomyces capsulatus TaxID=5037 RepID=A0A8A1LYW7_AJECA|nr:M protein repeat protein [Histoplasma capsulatum]